MAKINYYFFININSHFLGQTLKGHISDTVGQFELKFCMEAYFGRVWWGVEEHSAVFWSVARCNGLCPSISISVKV
jgi:hypothetical protein